MRRVLLLFGSIVFALAAGGHCLAEGPETPGIKIILGDNGDPDATTDWTIESLPLKKQTTEHPTPNKSLPETGYKIRPDMVLLTNGTISCIDDKVKPVIVDAMVIDFPGKDGKKSTITVSASTEQVHWLYDEDTEDPNNQKHALAPDPNSDGTIPSEFRKVKFYYWKETVFHHLKKVKCMHIQIKGTYDATKQSGRRET